MPSWKLEVGIPSSLGFEPISIVELRTRWLEQHEHVRRSSLQTIRRYRTATEPTGNQGQVAQLARERCRELLRAGTSFAFNATNTMQQTRGRWLDLFADYHARIEIVYLEPPFETLLRQNKARSKAVPEQVIRKLAEKCEPPTWIECHNLVIEGFHEKDSL